MIRWLKKIFRKKKKKEPQLDSFIQEVKRAYLFILWIEKQLNRKQRKQFYKSLKEKSFLKTPFLNKIRVSYFKNKVEEKLNKVLNEN